MPERDDNPTCRSLPPSMDCLATTDSKKGAGGEPKKKRTHRATVRLPSNLC